MPSMPTPKRFDLGDAFPDTSTDEVKDYVIVGPMWGNDWRVLTNVNLFTALAADDNPAKYAKLVSKAIHPDDRTAFLEKLEDQTNLDEPSELLRIINTIVGAASGNPPTSPSVSSTGTRRKAAAQR